MLLRSAALPMNEILEGDRKERLLWHTNYRMAGLEVQLRSAGGVVSEGEAHEAIRAFLRGDFDIPARRLPCTVVDDSMACPDDGWTRAAIGMAMAEVTSLWKRRGSNGGNGAKFIDFRIQTGGDADDPGTATGGKAYKVECCGGDASGDTPHFTVRKLDGAGYGRAIRDFDPRNLP